MSVALLVLGWVVAVLGGLVLALVLLPIHLRVGGVVAEDELGGRASVRWGFRLLELRADTTTGVDARLLGIRLWRYRPGKGGGAEEDEEPKAPRKAGRGRGAWRHWRGWLRLLGAVKRAIPVRGWVDGTLGFSDPADTGALFAVLDPLMGWSETVEIDLWPSWVDPALELEGELTVSLWPARVLGALLWVVLFDGDVRRGVWSMARANG